MRTDKLVMFVAAAAAACGIARVASADLKESQVLVVYDSRLADSKTVAEYYAGSAKVPGGAGGLPGVHPGVLVVDLAGLSGAGVVPAAANITYADYLTKIRNPLRMHLTTNGLSRSVRCLVLTKGLPHRILDTDTNNSGDQPTAASIEIGAGDATFASVDSELTLLHQNLETGEFGNGSDSKSDGGIVNPYLWQTQPISGFSTQNIQSSKIFFAAAGWTGVIWRNFTTGPSALMPGDIYLVCRLDGLTTTDVIAAIDRAQNISVDVNTATLLLDEAGADGVATTSDADTEFDNDGPTAYTNGGDDYEQTRDLLLADGRYAPANVRYNALGGAAQFFVGPLINFGGGIVVSDPVLLLATYGANHSGTPGASALQYPASFNYAPGAVFNTIESYNGRDFGGLGQGPAAQAQLSLFIASGGTFGIGNVWEPGSFSVPDNLMIARNFLLGNLSWAEAAWSSIPLLSWQQIVIGDPLARVRRTKEDINGDGRVDVADVYDWGSAASPPDLNRSGAADLTDWKLLLNSVRSTENGNMRPDNR